MTYQNFPNDEPGDEAYRPWFDRGIQTWNATMEGQLKFSPYPADSVMPVDIIVEVAHLGANTPYGGNWDPSGCWTYSDTKHNRWAARSKLQVNRDRLDWMYDTKHFAEADPEVVGEVFLHELGHSVGLDHTALYTGVEPGDHRTFSACNIMYAYSDPFLRGHECQGTGDALKTDDVTGAMAIYQPDAPDKPDVEPPDPNQYFPQGLCSDGGFLC